LLGFSGFAASLATKGLPYPEAWAAAAVAIEVFGPIALILGFLPRLTALLLVAFVVMASGTSHRYWEFTEAAARRAQKDQLLQKRRHHRRPPVLFRQRAGGLELGRVEVY
jgi:putative oxidoreductase